MERKRVALAKLLVFLFALTVVSWLLLQMPAFVDADTQLFLSINSSYDQNLAVLVDYFTFLGSVPMEFIWVALLFAFRRRDLALYVLVAILIEIAYVYLTKEIVARPRPYEALSNVQFVGPDFGKSWPSGHAAGAFVVAFVLGTRERRWLLPLVAVAILVSVGRVYIGVHYPFDVVGAAIAAAVIGYVVGRMDLSSLQAYFGQLGHRLMNRKGESEGDAVR